MYLLQISRKLFIYLFYILIILNYIILSFKSNAYDIYNKLI